MYCPIKGSSTWEKLALLCLPVLTLAGSAATLTSATGTASDHQDSAARLAQRDLYGSDWWYPNVRKQGTIPYGGVNSSTYPIWRNVRDFGARGNGIDDDTDAINNATFFGYRCDYESGCESQTTTPAIVYFPAGTYMVSRPLVMLYYTQFVGDATNLPVIKGTPDFFGIALLDSDPYLAYGVSWYLNQNNMWRQVRNFVLDITDLPATGAYHAMHWQVAQGTSVQNVVFNMVEGNPNSTQQGIFMDNGSGGWYEDLVFNGGGIGLFAGNQQWSSRNLTFNNCDTAIYQNWNWVFNYKSISINNCRVGVDLTQGGGTLVTTGSIILMDSVMNNVDIGILTTFSGNSIPVTGGTLIVDNVNFVDTDIAVASTNGTTIVPGNQRIGLFMQGRTYTASDEETQITSNLSCYQPQASSGRYQQLFEAPSKPPSLLTADGTLLERAKPQYQGVPFTNFVSIRDYGCIGDGFTDETVCVQGFLDSIGPEQIAFVDHGAYLVSETIEVPIVIKIVGEAWSYFMVDGASPTFGDMANPQPAFRVGQPGQVGAVEMSELIFQTKGSAPGAIMMEWNLAGSPGANGMWDVHWRIGGTNGTELQSYNCLKTPNQVTTVNPECITCFMLLHLTSTSSVLMSNNWGWVSDHEMDLPDHRQINLYSGRGILIESQGPTWVYGSSFEHNMLYNYQWANARNLYAGILQSETAYMQANPNSISAFPPDSRYSDPDFGSCFAATCYKTWGLRVYNSTEILVYGAGLYSFFDNYDSACLLTTNCQQHVVSIEKSEGVWIYGLSTVGGANMVQVDGVALVPAAANENGFADTVAVFEYP